jgi:hypothetical protein
MPTFPENLPAPQAHLLSRVWSFLHMARPVVETAKMDAAQRYIMLLDQMPADSAEWPNQIRQMMAFVETHGAALSANAPHQLPRNTQDLAVTSNVDISVNVANILFACQDPAYANSMWEILRSLVVQSAEPGQSPPLFSPPPQPGGVLGQIASTIDTIVKEREGEMSAGDPANICDSIVKCLNSPYMPSLVSQIVQHVMSGNTDVSNPANLIGSLIGGLQQQGQSR